MQTIVGRLDPSLSATAAALVLALALPAEAADWQKTRNVTVAANEYRFAPRTLSFKRGVAYRLHIDNRGKEMHEFHAPEFFRAVELGNPSVLNVDQTEIVVPPGEAKDLVFVAKTPGRYKLICSDHDWAGMIGNITIK